MSWQCVRPRLRVKVLTFSMTMCIFTSEYHTADVRKSIRYKTKINATTSLNRYFNKNHSFFCKLYKLTFAESCVQCLVLKQYS